MDTPLILLLPAMFLMGYYAGYSWHAVGDPQPHHDFKVQIVMPAFANLLIAAWLVLG
jgi:hypothetical protein